MVFGWFKKDNPEFKEGRRAYLNNLDLSPNPYQGIDSKRATQWELGWKEASKARGKIENRLNKDRKKQSMRRGDSKPETVKPRPNNIPRVAEPTPTSFTEPGNAGPSSMEQTDTTLSHESIQDDPQQASDGVILVHTDRFEEEIEYLTGVLEKARKRLLDQTRRNRLLNYKESARDVAIVDEMPDQVFEHLVLNDGSFYFDYCETEEDETSIDDAQPNDLDRTLPKSAQTELDTLQRYTDNRLQTPFSEKELERRLRRLYQEHRTLIEETGANNLYLAMGLLEWNDSREGSTSMRSPLMLLPVRLERMRKAGEAIYRLDFDDEALDTNYSLAEKLKREFDITLPHLDEEELPESYWQKVEGAIAARRGEGWALIREVSLGLFRFNKQIMWHDLNPDRWPKHSTLLDKKILKRVLLGAETGDRTHGQLSEEYPQDDINGKEARKLPLVLDADSSQYSALVDALENEDALVIEGPPGTGKSQTISNLIATALGNGLSVLFVAEKMAALEVVYKRLEEVGLGVFCLQLHGLKTSKKGLLESVKRRIELTTRAPQNMERVQSLLDQTRADLINLSKALNKCVGPENLPLHTIAWRVEKLKQLLPNKYDPVPIENSEPISLEFFQYAKNLLKDLGKDWAAIPDDARQAWRGFLPKQYKDSQREGIVTQLRGVLNEVDEVINWLEMHDVDVKSSCLCQLSRLMKFGTADPRTVMTQPPVGSDRALVYRVVHNDLMHQFRDLLKKFNSYLAVVQKVNFVFDYASPDSDNYANQLETHSQRLANVVCDAAVPLGSLSKEKESLNNVVASLTVLHIDAKPLISLTNSTPRTLEDFQKLTLEAKALVDGPKELSLHGSAFHTKPSVRNYCSTAQAEYESIVQQATKLPAFHIDRAKETERIQEAHEIINEHRDRWFVIFSGDYRRAKRVIRRLMINPKLFSRGPNFLQAIHDLVKYCAARDQFAENKDYQVSLGTLFSGIETDWGKLDEVIQFAQELREKVGSDVAQDIVTNWDSHVDRMTNTSEKIAKAVGEAKSYAKKHCFPKNLWVRPVSEIVNTLEPWSAKLGAATDAVAQGWYNTETSLATSLQAVESYRIARSKEKKIKQHSAYDAILQTEWKGSQTNVPLLQATYNWLKQAQDTDGINLEVLRWLFPSPDLYRLEYLQELVAVANKLNLQIERQTKHLASFGSVEINKWLGEETSLAQFQYKMDTCVDTISSLPLMVRWRGLNLQAREEGIESFANSVSEGVLTGDSCGDAYEYSVYTDLLDSEIHSTPILQNFGHTRYESLRERFAQLDKEKLELNAKRIANNLRNRTVPEGIGYGPVKNFSEKRLLIHEAGKKKRHIPIRRLVARTGNALQVLKPCFLMSPLSVAQYLAPGELEFDLVVMDEASQLRPEDALGAIARARKAIIVGDPKQLPPTSFFDTAVAEDEDLEEAIIDDTESILDVCLKQFPYRRLRWHYRSQHESLIQFSNVQFYDGDLIIFPSPKRDSRQYGVHLTRIEHPSYHNGRNRNEAEVVVENIIHHFHRHRNKSLGVATFNKRQAEEIMLLLDRARSDDPAIDELIEQHEAEDPLFIKNLENVQGDERDVIFISTTYGPEKAGGPVFQRFGPINSELGWRRLNVIATRARQRVEVFSSMHPTDIRVGENARRGVREFRNYLEYAGTGKVPEIGKPTGGSAESEFEEAVAQILEDLGYESVPQVGVAGFYIDLGVVHPDRPGEYLLGVECDGAAYHSALSIRDRDRLRQEILESKGWSIHRIWSTSWFHTRDAEIDRLKRVLQTRLDEDRRVWAHVAAYEEEPEVLEHARHVSEVEQQREVIEIRESLDEALERFWEINIQPHFPNRNNSILSKPMIRYLVSGRPELEAAWFNVIPMEIREHMEPQEREYLDDILDVISEYA